MDSNWIPLSTLQTPALQNNIAYLKSRNHELLQRFNQVSFGESLHIQKQGDWIRCRSQSEPPVWVIGEKDAGEDVMILRERIASLRKDCGLWVMVGGAIGYGVAAAIPFLLQNPGLRVVVVEPTVDRLFASLVLVDLSAAMITERLHFMVSEISVARILERMELFNLWGVEPMEVFLSPELEGCINSSSLKQAYKEHSLRAEERMQKILAGFSHTDLKSSPIERVMFINCWAGAPGGVHIQAIENCLKKRGIQTRTLLFNRYRFDVAHQEYRRNIESLILQRFQEYQPHVILSYGYHAPHFVSERVFRSMNAHWVQVVSNMAFYDKQQYEGEWTFLFEENLIPLFQRRGYHQAYFHSLMANYTRSQPVVSDGRFPVVILGNSLALPDEQVRDFWERWKGRDRLIEYLRKAEAALSEFDAQLSYFRYVEEDPIPQLENGEEEYAVFRYLLAQSSTVRRIQILERLAPLGLHVFGSGWERSLSPNSPIRACLRGYYPMQEEFRVFAQGTIFINIHTPCNDTGPNMRFFNVPGMGAFQISDCPHFDRYFKSGSEMIYCSTLQEFEDSTRYYLAHPQERDTLRFAAHQKVAENWTYDHWIDRIFPTLRKGYSFPLLGS